MSKGLVGSSVAMFILFSLLGVDSAYPQGSIVGWTQYDMQSNGSTGNRIALDSLGGIHFTWMNSPSYPGARMIYYNYLSPQGQWGWPQEGLAISDNRGGYSQIALTSNNRAAIAFHNTLADDTLFWALDSSSGSGNFSNFYPRIEWNDVYCLWPFLTIDRQGSFHLVASQANVPAGHSFQFGYCRSTDEGATWSPPQIVDTILTISPVLTSSPVSDMVALVYSHPFDTSAQVYNDIYYLVSDDGANWDFDFGKVNVTEYASDNDSLCAYSDLDGVFDYNDDLHIIWNAQLVGSFEQTSPDTRLLHYDIASGVVREITRSPFTRWPQGRCDLGVWNLGIAKMSIGLDEDNHLFVIFTAWDSTDCSETGYANGDIFMCHSNTHGRYWSSPMNLTHSRTPGCVAGDCDSDNWSSLAERVDNYLHLFYVNDKDAGAISHTEGAVTDNPMIYLRYQNPLPIGCYYIPGDINNNGSRNGIDIIFGVSYFKGGSPPPITCECPPGSHQYLFVAGDVNQDCAFNGLDITYMVGYYKGANSDLWPCLGCPPSR